jgi:hypothetical protein
VIKVHVFSKKRTKPNPEWLIVQLDKFVHALSSTILSHVNWNKIVNPTLNKDNDLQVDDIQFFGGGGELIEYFSPITTTKMTINNGSKLPSIAVLEPLPITHC